MQELFLTKEVAIKYAFQFIENAEGKDVSEVLPPSKEEGKSLPRIEYTSYHGEDSCGIEIQEVSVISKL